MRWATKQPGHASGGGGSGASGGPAASDDMVVFSDQLGLYTIVDGVTMELGTSPDYQVLTNLVLSPDGANLLHSVGRDTRVTSLADGAFVVDRQAGFRPGTWMDSATALVTTPGSASPASTRSRRWICPEARRASWIWAHGSTSHRARTRCHPMAARS